MLVFLDQTSWESPTGGEFVGNFRPSWDFSTWSCVFPTVSWIYSTASLESSTSCWDSSTASCVFPTLHQRNCLFFNTFRAC